MRKEIYLPMTYFQNVDQVCRSSDCMMKTFHAIKSLKFPFVPCFKLVKTQRPCFYGNCLLGLPSKGLSSSSHVASFNLLTVIEAFTQVCLRLGITEIPIVDGADLIPVDTL